MTKIFITGLSGVGKTTVLNQLNKRGYPTFDLDYGYTVYENGERLFDEQKVFELIETYLDSHLIISGTESNQGLFYDHFDYIILFEADLDTMLFRISQRTTNNYGKNQIEREIIINQYHEVLPLLRKKATLIIDTTAISPEELCEKIEDLLLEY